MQGGPTKTNIWKEQQDVDQFPNGQKGQCQRCQRSFLLSLMVKMVGHTVQDYYLGLEILRSFEVITRLRL